MKTPDFSDISGFDWDDGNRDKNWEKHNVTSGECEDLFFNEPFFTYFDDPHSRDENRYFGLGETSEGRQLFIVFTLRSNRIRIISARNMSKKERSAYENLKKDSTFQE